MTTTKKLFLIIFLALIIYLPSVHTFFISDDWFHLRISQISSLQEFLNFFKLSETPQSAAFYRPIPTQLFFSTFYSLFGLNPLPYHVLVLSFFTLSLYLVFKLCSNLFNEKIALTTTFLYSISATHFSRLYFLSAFQEIVMTIFVILSLLFYVKKTAFKFIAISLIFFILALASKETAVVLPVLLLLIDWKNGKINITRIAPFVLLALIYTILYITNFGLKSEGSYSWDFSPFKAANTLFWYTLWSFGAPEFLVDYVGSSLKILPRFFEQFPLWSKLILLMICSTLLSAFGLIFKNRNLFKKETFFGVIFYLTGILPVLFLPWHKFTLELTLPLIGFCIFLAYLIKGSPTIIQILFLTTFTLLNLASYLLTYQTNFAPARSDISKNIYNYLTINYRDYPYGSYFEFINDSQSSKDWGVSKQIAQVTSYSDMFKVIYKDNKIEVYFEDIPQPRPIDLNPIRLSTLQFLK
jgi:hypothetical protein